MLLEKENSCLLIVDVQEKLTPLVHKSEQLVKKCQWLMRLADQMTIPIVVSEQYPQGLGKTVEALQDFIIADKCINKVHFSSYHEPTFVKCWEGINKTQAVIAGIETHVCVLQTAMHLKEAGNQVFVVADAVSSRNEMDYNYALQRMRGVGIQIITSEMVFFEWVRQAGNQEFKALSQAFLR